MASFVDRTILKNNENQFRVSCFMFESAIRVILGLFTSADYSMLQISRPQLFKAKIVHRFKISTVQKKIVHNLIYSFHLTNDSNRIIMTQGLETAFEQGWVNHSGMISAGVDRTVIITARNNSGLGILSKTDKPNWITPLVMSLEDYTCGGHFTL